MKPLLLFPTWLWKYVNYILYWLMNIEFVSKLIIVSSDWRPKRCCTYWCASTVQTNCKRLFSEQTVFLCHGRIEIEKCSTTNRFYTLFSTFLTKNWNLVIFQFFYKFVWIFVHYILVYYDRIPKNKLKKTIL